jgi:hypothetical protein
VANVFKLTLIPKFEEDPSIENSENDEGPEHFLSQIDHSFKKSFNDSKLVRTILISNLMFSLMLHLDNWNSLTRMV